MHHRGITLFRRNPATPTPMSYRENSLYWFVMENLTDEVLAKHIIDHGMQSDRRVVYIKLPPSTELPPVFSGFICKEQHLSIDQSFRTDASPLSSGFSPSHLTMIYENTTTRHFIHVYFNRHGQLLNTQIKSALCRQTIAEAHDVPFDNTMQALIYKHAVPCQELVKTLINRKAQIYSELTAKYHIKERELSILLLNLDHASEKNEALHKITELQTLIETQNRYNDMKEISGSQLDTLAARLHSMQDIAPVTVSASSSVVVESPLTILSAIPASASQASASYAPISAVRALMTRVQNLVENINQCWENTSDKHRAILEIQPLVVELDLQILDLQFNHASKKVKHFIEYQQAQLIFHTKLPNYFREKMLQGDLAAVSALYDSIDTQYDISDFFSTFLVFFEKCSDLALNHKLATIAEFFYSKSEQYRSGVTCLSMMFHFNPEKEAGHGVLLRLFISNNLPFFRLLLQQGVLPKEGQYLYQMKPFNALHSLVLHFHLNPDPAFINALFDYGATVESLPCNVAILHANMHSDMTKKISKSSHCTILSRLPDSTNINQTLQSFMLTLHQINHAFVLAIKLGFSPELIEILAPLTDIETIFKQLSAMLNDPMFSSRILYFSTTSQPLILPSLEATNRVSSERIMNTSDANRIGLLFFLSQKTATNKAQDSIYATAQFLLSMISDQFLLLPIEKQRAFITHWKDKARTFLQAGNIALANEANIMALLANSLIRSPVFVDDEMMLRLFCIKNEIVMRSNPEVGAGYYRQALAFVTSLPSDRRTPLMETALYNYIRLKTEKAAEPVCSATIKR